MTVLKKLGFFYLFFLSPIFSYATQTLDIPIRGHSAIIINARTGNTLFEYNSETPLPPASTTKISVALFLLSHYKSFLKSSVLAHREALKTIEPSLKRTSQYKSPPFWLETDGSNIEIKPGEELLFSDLLQAMLIASANDAANCLAHFCEGSIPKFMTKLNSYLKDIGCQNTFFNNPHGLHHPSHTTTAKDLSLMAKEGLKNPLFREFVKKTKSILNKTNMTEERSLQQTNKLLINSSSFYYPKAIGIKTGFTKDSGRNLVAAAEHNGQELIAVAMGYKHPQNYLYDDIINMFERAFNSPLVRTYLLQPNSKLTVKIPKKWKKLLVTLEEGVFYDHFSVEDFKPKITIKWLPLTLPINQGDTLGYILIKNSNNELLKQSTITAPENIPKGNLSTKVVLKILVLGVTGFYVVFKNKKRTQLKHKRSLYN